jgi:hypothetical protein
MRYVRYQPHVISLPRRLRQAIAARARRDASTVSIREPREPHEPLRVQQRPNRTETATPVVGTTHTPAVATQATITAVSNAQPSANVSISDVNVAQPAPRGESLSQTTRQIIEAEVDEIEDNYRQLLVLVDRFLAEFDRQDIFECTPEELEHVELLAETTARMADTRDPRSFVSLLNQRFVNETTEQLLGVQGTRIEERESMLRRLNTVLVTLNTQVRATIRLRRSMIAEIDTAGTASVARSGIGGETVTVATEAGAGPTLLTAGGGENSVLADRRSRETVLNRYIAGRARAQIAAARARFPSTTAYNRITPVTQPTVHENSPTRGPPTATTTETPAPSVIAGRIANARPSRGSANVATTRTTSRNTTRNTTDPVVTFETTATTNSAATSAMTRLRAIPRPSTTRRPATRASNNPSNPAAQTTTATINASQPTPTQPTAATSAPNSGIDPVMAEARDRRWADLRRRLSTRGSGAAER